MEATYNPFLNLIGGLMVLIPYAGYHLTLLYARRNIPRLRNTGRLTLSPTSYNCETVRVGGQYTYLDNDAYEDYFWVEQIAPGLGLIQISLYLEDGKLVRNPLAKRYWTHEVPTNQPFDPGKLARTQIGALLKWMNAEDSRRSRTSIAY